MAESCQAYKCTYGSRLEYLFSFIIFPFFFPIHQVTSLLATQPWRPYSRKELHFWWELIRQAFTWNSSRLLRVPELGWQPYNLLRGTNCSDVCSGTEGGLASAEVCFTELVLCRAEQKRIFKTNSKETESQSLHKGLSLFWKTIRPALWLCPARVHSHTTHVGPGGKW